MKARVTLRTSTPLCSKKRLSSAATNAFCTNSGISASGTQCRRLSGSNSSANFAPVPSSTVVMPGSLQALEPVVVGQVGRRPVVELDHLIDVDHLAVDLLVLAQLLVGEVQVVELDALEAGDLAGRGLLVDHHGVDQAVEIDVLDVERLAHGVAAGAEHGHDFGLVGGGIELCLDGVRPGHDQAEGKGRGEHLNEDRFHVFDETLGRPPLISIIQKGELTVGNSSSPAKNIS